MGEALRIEPRRLTIEEIEEITGVEREHPQKQCNRLRRVGIKAFVNDRREVVCFWSWIDIAALPPEVLNRYIPPRPANDEDDDDIGMNLEAIGGKRKKT